MYISEQWVATRVIGRESTSTDPSSVQICSASSTLGLRANILIIPAPLNPFSISIWQSPPFFDLVYVMYRYVNIRVNTYIHLVSLGIYSKRKTLRQKINKYLMNVTFSSHPDPSLPFIYVYVIFFVTIVSLRKIYPCISVMMYKYQWNGVFYWKIYTTSIVSLIGRHRVVTLDRRIYVNDRRYNTLAAVDH